MNLKGSLPLLILHTLSKGRSHGYRIAKLIREQSDGILDFKEGTLYPTLHNLEKKGYVTAQEDYENGRKRRYYQLTNEGKERLETERGEWEQYAGAVNTILDANGS